MVYILETLLTLLCALLTKSHTPMVTLYRCGDFMLKHTGLLTIHVGVISRSDFLNIAMYFFFFLFTVKLRMFQNRKDWFEKHPGLYTLCTAWRAHLGVWYFGCVSTGRINWCKIVSWFQRVRAGIALVTATGLTMNSVSNQRRTTHSSKTHTFPVPTSTLSTIHICWHQHTPWQVCTSVTCLSLPGAVALLSSCQQYHTSTRGVGVRMGWLCGEIRMRIVMRR